jgi:hypothetical protein
MAVIGGFLFLLALILVFAVMVWSYVSIILAGPIWLSLLFVLILFLGWQNQGQ